jgi:hypothetical protein
MRTDLLGIETKMGKRPGREVMRGASDGGGIRFDFGSRSEGGKGPNEPANQIGIGSCVSFRAAGSRPFVSLSPPVLSPRTYI